MPWVKSGSRRLNHLEWTTVTLKVAGIALKRPKMLRKHHKFREGDKVRNSDVFLLLFWPLNNDRLSLHTNSYNISVTQQRFTDSHLWAWGTCVLILPIVVLWRKGDGHMKPCDKSGDEYKPLLPANSLPRDIWPNKENFWKNSSFPCCDLLRNFEW